MVDCVGYPYLVFSRQCQVFPYSSPSPSFVAPFSSVVVLHNIARTQVRTHPYTHTITHQYPYNNALIQPYHHTPILSCAHTTIHLQNVTSHRQLPLVQLARVSLYIPSRNIIPMPYIYFTLCTSLFHTPIPLWQGLQSLWRGWYSHIFLIASRRFTITMLDRFITPPR